MLVGAKAESWGRKPLYLAAFLILPVRGALYTLSDDMAWLVGVQLLDGVGAGLFGALLPLSHVSRPYQTAARIRSVSAIDFRN